MRVGPCVPRPPSAPRAHETPGGLRAPERTRGSEDRVEDSPPRSRPLSRSVEPTAPPRKTLKERLRALGRKGRELVREELSEPFVFAGLGNFREAYLWSRAQTHVYDCRNAVDPQLDGEARAHSESLLAQGSRHVFLKNSTLFRGTWINNTGAPLPPISVPYSANLFLRGTIDLVYEHLSAHPTTLDEVQRFVTEPPFALPETAEEADALHRGERFSLMRRGFAIENLSHALGPMAPLGACVVGAALNQGATALERWIDTTFVEKLAGDEVQISKERIIDFMGEGGTSFTAGLQDFPAPNPYSFLGQWLDGVIWKRGYDRSSLFFTTVLKLMAYVQTVHTRQKVEIDRYAFDLSNEESRVAFERFSLLSPSEEVEAELDHFSSLRSVVGTAAAASSSSSSSSSSSEAAGGEEDEALDHFSFLRCFAGVAAVASSSQPDAARGEEADEPRGYKKGREQIWRSQDMLEKAVLPFGQKLYLSEKITEREGGEVETLGGRRLELSRVSRLFSWEDILGRERDDQWQAFTLQWDHEPPRSGLEWFHHRTRLSPDDAKIERFLSLARRLGYQTLERSEGPYTPLPCSPTPLTPKRPWSVCGSAQQEDAHLFIREEGLVRIASADYETAFETYKTAALALSPEIGGALWPRSVKDPQIKETSLSLLFDYLRVEDGCSRGFEPGTSYARKRDTLERRYYAHAARSIVRDAAMLRPILSQAERFARATTSLLPDAVSASFAERTQMEERFAAFRDGFGADPFPAIAALVSLAGREETRVRIFRLHAHGYVLSAPDEGMLEEGCHFPRKEKDAQDFHARAFKFPEFVQQWQPGPCPDAALPVSSTVGVPGVDPALGDRF